MSSIQVLSIGTFDGVHRGHQALLERAALHARRLSSGFAVLTFDPPPKAVLRPDSPVAELTPRQEKVSWLEAFGATEVDVIPFTAEFARVEAEAFLEEWVWERFHPAVLIEGHDFTFGREARGTIEVLRRWAAAHAITLEVLEPVRLDGVVVSSTEIRGLVRDGQLSAARVFLGHPFAAYGRVERGEARGRRLGFPTANVALAPTKQMPPYGIYAGMTRLADGERYMAVASWGVRPMFQTCDPMLEVHILDYAGSLYDQMLWFEFESYLRPEAAFAGLEELQAAMQADVTTARARLAGG
ncbi:MAG: riboflavin biosynthesis protein RibF [Clostridia bacterium]